MYLGPTSIGLLVTAIEAKYKEVYRRHETTILLFLHSTRSILKVAYYPKNCHYKSPFCIKWW
jgi:hypothetical protein